LTDVCADISDGHLTGLLVRAGRRDSFVPTRDVLSLGADGARVSSVDRGNEFHRGQGEVRLARELLDREVIDRTGPRIVRVNDIALGVREGVLSVVGVDVSSRALLRRLAPRWLGGCLSEALVEWPDLEPLAAELPDVPMPRTHRALDHAHPADLARLVDHLPHRHGAELLASLESATAADVLEEVERKRQAGLLEHLSADRAPAMLNEMAPDAAADLLGDLRPEHAERLLLAMDASRSAVVRLLLTYPADSAGGIMTTDFVIALEQDTGRRAIEYIRGQLEKPDLAYYVYVVDDPDNRRVRGVVSLRDLLLANPDEPLASYMARSVRAVRPEAKADEAARAMREYNLLALPVVDDLDRMLGLVTADDVLDVLLPEQVRRHVPRLFS
jgi:CBS domain-containing protein/sporulation protein YlmC with PRC-barrel domain